MKNTSKTMAILLAVAVTAIAARAQDDNTNTPPGGFRGPGGHRPPMPLIIGALDANHDGVIDADEIANAPAVLKTLDKNGDGKLTPDEFMGRPPMGGPRHGGGPNGSDAGGPPAGDQGPGPDGMGGPDDGGPGGDDAPPQDPPQ